MCGIFAYTGNKKATPILLEGLLSLEYRGYDSAGIFVPKYGVVKTIGGIEKLRAKVKEGAKGQSGIAHLRWATHGEPSEINAHPHSGQDGKLWLVHNGIIENFEDLKKKLIAKGHKFKSSTDTEVLAHLIESYLFKNGFEEAVRLALREVKGTYGIAVAYKKEPEKIIAARMGAPVVIGLGEGENFIASDSSPILRYTKRVIYLSDGDVAVITPSTHRISNLLNGRANRKISIIEGDLNQASKGNFKYFMQKEIMEGPVVVKNTLRGRLIPDKGLVKLGGLEAVEDRLRKIKRIIIVGCGTAYYAGVVGEYMIEEYTGIPVEVEVGSEFRYRKPIIDETTALLAISQSGETADTLEAISEAKRKGALTLGIVNVVGSTIARETDAGIYNHAGPEIGVASTKAFISQLVTLALLTVFLGRQRQMSLVTGKRITSELLSLPEKLEKIFKQKEIIEKCVKKYKNYKDFLYMGRKYNYATAFEGALKLKEISYVHAEGCGAGEMKHGPLAMIDEKFPTVAIALNDSVYEKMISNIQEIKARKGPVIAVATEGNKEIKKLVDDVFYIPKTIEMLTPILAVVPLQLFAYYFAHSKGLNVDRPRNLAKSVTVE